MRNSGPEQIVNTLSAVPERSMRTHLLTEKLCALDPDTVAEVLQTIITAAAQQRGNYCLALEALNVPLLTSMVGNAFMSDVYVHARSSGYEELVQILLRPDPSRVSSNARAKSSDDIPSGIRISMAKSGNRQQLERLFSDTNPLVIRTLLKNPALTESDVLKLSSKRPAEADIQREVFSNRKWSARYAVKKALALNPYTPTEISIKIVHMLMVQDVRLVAGSRDLHQWLREAAQERLGE